MYVFLYTLRPIFQIRNGRDQSLQVLTVTYAILRFLTRICQGRLVDANSRAERAFAGQLEQHFVVLKDNQNGATGLCTWIW
jgi:hypothetical protein